MGKYFDSFTKIDGCMQPADLTKTWENEFKQLPVTDQILRLLNGGVVTGKREGNFNVYKLKHKSIYFEARLIIADNLSGVNSVIYKTVKPFNIKISHKDGADQLVAVLNYKHNFLEDNFFIVPGIWLDDLESLIVSLTEKEVSAAKEGIAKIMKQMEDYFKK